MGILRSKQGVLTNVFPQADNRSALVTNKIGGGGEPPGPTVFPPNILFPTAQTITATAFTSIVTEPNTRDDTVISGVVQVDTDPGFGAPLSFALAGPDFIEASVAGLVGETNYFIRAQHVGDVSGASGFGNVVAFATEEVIVSDLNVVGGGTQRVGLIIPGIDDQNLTLSVWFNASGISGNRQFINFTGTLGTITRVSLTNGDQIQVTFLNQFVTSVQANSNDAQLRVGLNHLIVSFTDGSPVIGYLNDLPLTFTGGQINSNTFWASTVSNVVCNAAFSAFAEFWMHDEFINITDEANRRLFISPTGEPVPLGPNGEIPLAQSPRIFFGSDWTATDWNATGNLGTADDFDHNGAQFHDVFPGFSGLLIAGTNATIYGYQRTALTGSLEPNVVGGFPIEAIIAIPDFDTVSLRVTGDHEQDAFTFMNLNILDGGGTGGRFNSADAVVTSPVGETLWSWTTNNAIQPDSIIEVYISNE